MKHRQQQTRYWYLYTQVAFYHKIVSYAYIPDRKKISLTNTCGNPQKKLGNSHWLCSLVNSNVVLTTFWRKYDQYFKSLILSTKVGLLGFARTFPDKIDQIQRRKETYNRGEPHSFFHTFWHK